MADEGEIARLEALLADTAAALGGLASLPGAGWDRSSRRVVYLAVSLRAGEVQDVATRLILALDKGTDEDGLGRGVLG